MAQYVVFHKVQFLGKFYFYLHQWTKNAQKILHPIMSTDDTNLFYSHYNEDNIFSIANLKLEKLKSSLKLVGSCWTLRKLTILYKESFQKRFTIKLKIKTTNIKRDTIFRFNLVCT